MFDKLISAITVTRKVPEGSEAQIVDSENGEEIVASITADQIITLDGYQVQISEVLPDKQRQESGEQVDFIIDVDDAEGYRRIEAELAEMGVPLDQEIISLVIDSWHNYLNDLGIAHMEEWEEDEE